MKKWNLLSSTSLHKTDWVEFLEDRCESNLGKLTYSYMRSVDQGLLINPEDVDELWMVRQGLIRDEWTLAGLYLYEDYIREEMA